VPELSEYQALLERKKAERATREQEQRRAVIPRALDIAHKAQQVVDHPAWQWYLDRVDQRITQIEAARLTKIESMVHGTAMGHELELLKIELNTMEAEAAGLRYAQSLIAEAVKLGHDIVAETGVNGQAAAASNAG